MELLNATLTNSGIGIITGSDYSFVIIVMASLVVTSSSAYSVGHVLVSGTLNVQAEILYSDNELSEPKKRPGFVTSRTEVVCPPVPRSYRQGTNRVPTVRNNNNNNNNCNFGILFEHNCERRYIQFQVSLHRCVLKL